MEILIGLASLAGLTVLIIGCIRGRLFATIFMTLALGILALIFKGDGDGGAVGVCGLLIWGAWMARIYRRRRSIFD